MRQSFSEGDIEIRLGKTYLVEKCFAHLEVVDAVVPQRERVQEGER